MDAKKPSNFRCQAFWVLMCSINAAFLRGGTIYVTHGVEAATCHSLNAVTGAQLLVSGTGGTEVGFRMGSL